MSGTPIARPSIGTYTIMMIRCECWRLGFVELRRFARRRGIRSLRELMQLTGCGTQCGKCRPHLREFLRTGCVRVGDQCIALPDPPPRQYKV